MVRSVVAIFFVSLVLLTGRQDSTVLADSSETCHSIDQRGNCVTLEELAEDEKRDEEMDEDNMGLELFSDKDLIVELRSRGYQVRRKPPKKKRKDPNQDKENMLVGKRDARKINGEAINAAEQGRIGGHG